MSNILSSMSNIGNRPQLIGLGSKGFDTQAMLQLELDMLEMRKTPYLERVKNLETQKSAWNALQNSLSNFNSLVSTLKDFSTSNKSVGFVSEGYVGAEATSDAVSGTYDIEVSQLASSHRVMSGKVEGSIGFEGTAQLNGIDLELTSDMTIKDLALKINEGDYGVSAIVLDDQMVLTSATSGVENSIEFGTSDVFETLGFTDGGLIKNELNQAQNAIYKINGVELESATNQVTDIDGVSLTLKKETTGPVEFKIETSTEDLIEHTKKMVEGYNNLMKTLGTLGGEAGVLQSEMLPRRVKMSLGSVFSGSMVGGNTLRDIGISFDPAASGGGIKVDSEKLTEMFNSDPESVMGLISGENGMSTKIFNIIDRYTSEGGLIDSRKDGIDDRIERSNNTIERFDRSFERQQESLLLKYARLDVMMKQLEMQKSYIDAQLGQFEMDAKR